MKKEVAVSLEKALVRARTIAPKLGSSTDTLNKAIEEVEAALKALRLGVQASIMLVEDHQIGEELSLIFAKFGQNWQLIVQDNNSETWEPLTNSSRELRLRAVELLPALVDELVRQAEQELERVSQATDSAKQLAATLKTGEKGS